MDNKQRIISQLKRLRTEAILNTQLNPDVVLKIEELIREVQSREALDWAEIGEYKAQAKGILRRAALH